MAVVLHFAYPMALTVIKKVGMVNTSLWSSGLWNVIYSVLLYHVSCFVIGRQHYISE